MTRHMFVKGPVTATFKDKKYKGSYSSAGPDCSMAVFYRDWVTVDFSRRMPRKPFAVAVLRKLLEDVDRGGQLI